MPDLISLAINSNNRSLISPHMSRTHSSQSMLVVIQDDITVHTAGTSYMHSVVETEQKQIQEELCCSQNSKYANAIFKSNRNYCGMRLPSQEPEQRN